MGRYASFLNWQSFWGFFPKKVHFFIFSVLYKVMTRSYKVYAKLTKGCLLTYKGLLASIQGIYRGDVWGCLYSLFIQLAADKSSEFFRAYNRAEYFFFNEIPIFFQISVYFLLYAEKNSSMFSYFSLFSTKRAIKRFASRLRTLLASYSNLSH